MPPDASRYSALSRRLVEMPREGKTYTLFGEDAVSDGYYSSVAELADRSLARSPDPRALIEAIRRAATSKLRIRRAIAAGSSADVVPSILVDARRLLAPYTRNVGGHLAGLTIAHRFDRTIAMNESQYHLAMLEIELLNRLHRSAFNRVRARLAFLPHCLRDTFTDCRAESDGIDEVCRGCTAECWNNAASALLRSRGVRPYIWMTANLPRLFRRVIASEGSLGVLGIACVPELARGMRSCERHGIPVVGLPLNGNRCARWTGSFQENSINLSRLEGLLTG
jgi:hypothetical protein